MFGNRGLDVKFGAKRPNILLITADDMNFNSAGVYGCGIESITPNMDRLASEGVQFIHSHVTIAVCQPSRSVWMTGTRPISAMRGRSEGSIAGSARISP